MKMKKLTALISAVMLALCAVPMGAGAENLMGDLNSNGVIDNEDVDLMWDFIFNGDSSDKYTDEEKEFFHKYGDLDGNGKIDFYDIPLLSESNGDVTINNEIGDVNHDGFVNAIDATKILMYYADLSTGNEGNYTEEQHENFRIYGDIYDMGDGAVNAVDATEILILYAERSTSLSK